MDKINVIATLILFGFTFLGFFIGASCKFVDLVFKWFERKVLEK